jgi:putative ABC transport system substrate-binding protein
VKRWALCFLGIAVLAALPLPGVAQQPAKPFRIGVLSPAGSPSTKAFDSLRKGLRELGYIEGANITIEYRLAAGDYG